MTRPVAYSGAKLTVAYAVCADGSSLGLEFVEALHDDESVKLHRLFMRLSETGRIDDDRKFKKLKGESNLWEFKCGQIRMLCFYDGRFVVITHGFTKKSDSTPKSEIERAMRVRSEDLT